MGKIVEIRSHVRELKMRYLDECGVIGGDAATFVKRCVADSEQNPLWKQALAELAAQQGQSIWEQEPPPATDEQGELFEVGRRVLPQTLTIPDKKTPKNFRKVKLDYATIEHRREDAIVKYRVAARAMAAAEADMQQADLLEERAQGNRQALILDHTDRKHGLEYGDETDEDRYR